jgi:hypothetical protein
MKFLCVACDEAMKLTQTAPPDAAGSLAVRFACPACGREIAMLTNPWETEMVSSLGVRIGPAGAGGAAATAARGAAATEPAANGGGAPAAAEATTAGPRCPFSGVVREMEAAHPSAGPVWTPAALSRLDNIPDFVRPMAKQGIEHYATSNGYPEIDERVLEEARERFGM